MKKSVSLIIIAVLTILMGQAVYADGANAQQVNIQEYGAKGDGITDDTKAIQRAIDYASKNNMTVVFPASNSNYIIKDSVILKSDTHIIGYGATVFMEAQDSLDEIFYSDDNDYVSNVSIEGLNLKSANSKNGTGLTANSMTSNVEGVCIYGVDGLTIKNVQMDNMSIGLKLGPNANGKHNTNISVNGLNIYNSRTPLFTSTTNHMNVSDSILDANGGYDHRLHSAYIEGDTSDFYFDNVVFRNSPGGGIHIYNESAGKAAGKNMVFTNITIENCRVGVYVWSGAENIKISKTSITKCDTAFSVNGSKGLQVSEINISDFTRKYDGDMGAFVMVYSSNSNISDIKVDGSNMGGSLFDLGDEVEELSVSAVTVENMNDSGFFYSTAVVKGLMVENSNFEWNRITNQRLSFRGAGTEATFRNNSFVNNGELFNSLGHNYSGTNVVMENNSYSGFESLEYGKADVSNVKLAASSRTVATNNTNNVEE